MHKTDVHSIKDLTRGPENIVFIEVDAKWVHHALTDALVITVRIANNIVHRMLVDNISAANIFFWDAYRKIGLTQVDLSPTTSPLYGLIGDHVIPKGTIKLVVTLGEHPRVSTVVTKFFTVDGLSTFNGVIGRLLLRSLKAVTSIHCLTMKFPTIVGIGQV